MAKKKTSTKVEEVKEEVIESVESEEVTEEPTPEPEVEKEEPKKEESRTIGSLKGGNAVHQKQGFLRVKAVRGPVSKRELPADIQRWLTNKGYGTNIYLRSKEELERRHVDLKMVEKLKKFISERYL